MTVRKEKKEIVSGLAQKIKDAQDVTLETELNPSVIVLENGTEILPPQSEGSVTKKKKTGGKRPGAGRKKHKDKLSNYNKALNLLDDSIIPALHVLREGMFNSDPEIQYKCASKLLDKVIPNKKRVEHTGEGGGPVDVEVNVNSEEVVAELFDLIDARMAERKKREIENDDQ